MLTTSDESQSLFNSDFKFNLGGDFSLDSSFSQGLDPLSTAARHEHLLNLNLDWVDIPKTLPELSTLDNSGEWLFDQGENLDPPNRANLGQSMLSDRDVDPLTGSKDQALLTELPAQEIDDPTLGRVLKL